MFAMSIDLGLYCFRQILMSSKAEIESLIEASQKRAQELLRQQQGLKSTDSRWQQLDEQRFAEYDVQNGLRARRDALAK